MKQQRPKTVTYLENVHSQMDQIVEKLGEEKEHIKSLDKQLESYQSKIISLQREHRPVNERENKKAIDNTLRIIEKRTNQGIDKLNSLNTESETLRKRIDEMRQERVVYDGIYKKLEKELHLKTRDMSRVIEEGRRAIVARDRIKDEVQNLRQVYEEEMKEYEKDRNELFRLQECNKTERQSRKFRTHPQSKKLDKAKRLDSDSDNLSSPENVGSISCAGLRQNSLLKYLESPKDIAAAIVKATGVTCIDEVVRILSESTNKTFSLFQYCSDINADIEELEIKLEGIREQIELEKRNQRHTPHKRKIDFLQEQKSALLEKTTRCRTRIVQSRKAIDQMKTAIKSMFDTVGCEVMEGKEIFANGFSNSNVLQCIGLIEQVRKKFICCKLFDQQTFITFYYFSK